VENFAVAVYSLTEKCFKGRKSVGFLWLGENVCSLTRLIVFIYKIHLWPLVPVSMQE